MSAFDLLNQACVGEEYKTSYSWDNLKIGEYPIDHFTIIDRFGGDKLYVVLENGYELQLPKRCFGKVNQQNQIDELNTEKNILIWNGKDPKKGNKLLIKFRKVVDSNSSSASTSELNEEPAQKRQKKVK